MARASATRFRKYATWQRPSGTIDEFGNPDGEWTDVISQRCHIVAQTSYSERTEAGKETAKAGVIITTRYRQEIAFNEDYRIVHRGMIYDIEKIENEEQMDRYLIFHAIITTRQVAALATNSGDIMGGLDGSNWSPL